MHRLYSEKFQQEPHLTAATFGIVLNRVFPTLSRTKVNINGTTTASYLGLAAGYDKENDKYSNATDNDIIHFSTQYGFHGKRKGTELILYKMASELVNGQPVLKEVHITERDSNSENRNDLC